MPMELKFISICLNILQDTKSSLGLWNGLSNERKILRDKMYLIQIREKRKLRSGETALICCLPWNPIWTNHIEVLSCVNSPPLQCCPEWVMGLAGGLIRTGLALLLQPLITHQVNPQACHLGRSAFFKSFWHWKKRVSNQLPGLVVNIANSRSEQWSLDMGSNPCFT